MKTVSILRVDSTTIHGKNPRRVGNWPTAWTKTLCLPKVRTFSQRSVSTKTLTSPGTGYKEYKTDRKYMARMGDWRDNKDFEIPLDGIGGVNILVKADVHRSGTSNPLHYPIDMAKQTCTDRMS